MGALSKHQDPIAVVLSSVVGMLGALGLIERAGLTADQVAQLMGFSLAIVAALRTVFERKRHRELVELRARGVEVFPEAVPEEPTEPLDVSGEG